ncbi:hypothetical protein FRB91_007107 [Serendipita sp. 411]|nr:hypothetical protein FRB91_007107 [Serendipita sp. 411]
MRLFVQSAASLASTLGRVPAQRCIATSSSLRKGKLGIIELRSKAHNSTVTLDLVQDLYLRELKSYKPIPAAKDAHVGAVREFKAPQAPETPTLPGDLASELSTYASSEPILDSKTAGAASKDGKDAAPPADNKLTGPALLKFLEEDLPKDDHHHH